MLQLEVTRQRMEETVSLTPGHLVELAVRTADGRAILQDEKFPGVHIAFGSPGPNQTGADWDCK